jgi:DNA-binding response OmpR family regulator
LLQARDFLFPFMSQTQHRALLVVESSGLQLFYGQALAADGFEVLVAPDGETGLSFLRTPQPMIVVLDLMLAGMSGTEFIRNLRVQRSMAPPPVVVLPLLDSELAHAATEAGATRVLVREQAPLRTLTLLAHAQARMRGVPNEPTIPPAAEWQPHALQHVRAMRDAVHALTRDAADPSAPGQLARHAHGLAEMLHLTGVAGLADFATALESLILGVRAIGLELSPTVRQTLGQAVDFLGRQLEELSPEAAQSTSDCRVLVVDDDPSVCHLVEAALGIVGLKTQVAHTPSGCLQAVGSGSFDVVVLDIGLPEMSGFDLCTKIRGTPGHANVPILFLTGLTSFQNRAKSVLTGGNDFICKPFAPLELGLKVLLWVHQGRKNK